MPPALPPFPKHLPDDIDALKTLLIEQRVYSQQLQTDKQTLLHNNAQLHADKDTLSNTITQLYTENNHKQSRILSLQEQLNIALANRYAASSEKISPDQIRLFDEAEVDGADGVNGNADRNGTDKNAIDDDLTRISEHTRKKKTGRKPLPESLPRLEVIHTLSEADQFCDHDGRALMEIGEVTCEQLDIIPATIQVIRHIRKKYACDCGQCIKTAPLPNQPIPKSIAAPGLLAHIAVSKYQDALPLYRQEQILQRIGVDIPRATLANWMIKTGQLIQPVINLLRDRLLAYDILHMDETTVQVLDEPDKTPQSTSYLWLQRGGPPDKPVVLLDYDPSRSQSVPQRLLDGFSGYLHTDGYAGYHAAVTKHHLNHVGCFAHARRKFTEAVNAQGKGKGKNKKRGKAHRGLGFIQRLYKIEKAVRKADADDRYAYRLQHAQPVLKQMRSWLDDTLPQIPPKSATGKALHYLHHEWDKLIRYLEDGRLEIDNNKAENAIRPFVIGRKNWLFSQSVKGVKASANLYSLIETAKANGLEPYAYLRMLFAELPKAATVEEIEALLPGDVNRDRLTQK